MINSMKRLFNRKNQVLVITLFTVLSLMLGFLFLGKKDLSLDEIATALIVKDWSNMLHILTYTEGNMWLYYLLLHFWQVFGTNEFALRSLSVIFGSASIPVIYLLAKKLCNTRTATIAVLLTSLNVFFISNVQNTRAYSLVLLLTSLSAYFFVKFVLSSLAYNQNPQKKYLIFTILFNVLAVYTHLYALLVIASQIVALIITFRKKLLQGLYYFVPLLFIFILPIAFLPSLHSGQINWIPFPGMRNLIGTLLILSSDFPPIAVIYLLLFGGFFVSVWKKRKKLQLFTASYWHIKYLFVWLLLPIVVSFLFSLLIKPLYISMYFIICLVPFTILVSFFMTQIKPVWLQRLVLVMLILFSSVRLYGWHSGNQALQLVISNNNEDWRGVANFLANNAKSTDAILFFPPYVQGNINYYLQKNSKPFDKKREIAIQPDMFSGSMGSEEYEQARLETIPANYHRLWYIYGNYTDRTRTKQESLINTALVKNYVLARVVNFYAITAYLYIKK